METSCPGTALNAGQGMEMTMNHLISDPREPLSGPPPLRTLLPAATAMTAVWLAFFVVLFVL